MSHKKYTLLLAATALNALPLLSTAQAESFIEVVEVEGQSQKHSPQQLQSRSAGGFSIVDAEQFKTLNLSNLADASRDLPGLWIASGSGDDNVYISSRGSNLDSIDYDINGIRLLQDGLPITAADGSNHNRIFDPQIAEHISYARSSNALYYGSSNIGGAMNMVSRTGRTQPRLEWTSNLGSFGLVNNRLSLAESNDTVDGFISIEQKTRDGYRDHNRQNRKSLEANLGWQINTDLYWQTFISVIDNRQDLPSSLSEEQYRSKLRQAAQPAIDGNYQLNVKTSRLANKLQWDIDPDSVLIAGISYERQDLYHPIVAPVIIPNVGEVFSLLKDEKTQNYAATVRYHLTRNNHQITFGLDNLYSQLTGENHRNSHGKRNGVTSKIDQTAQEVSAYWLDDWQLADKLSFLWGAQYVYTTRKDRGLELANGEFPITPPVQHRRSKHYKAFNPRAGLIYQISDYGQLYTHISRVFEAPSFASIDDRRSSLGLEADLKAITGNELEIGARGDWKDGKNQQLQWEVSAYYMQLKNEILSFADANNGGDTNIAFNADKTVHAGLESFVSGQIALADQHYFSPKLTFTYNHFKFRNDSRYGNNILANAPNFIINSEWLYRHNKGFYAGPTLDWVGRRYVDYANTKRISGHHLLGFKLGLIKESWNIYAEARNINNTRHVSTLSIADTFEEGSRFINPGSPRAFYLGWRVSY